MTDLITHIDPIYTAIVVILTEASKKQLKVPVKIHWRGKAYPTARLLAIAIGFLVGLGWWWLREPDCVSDCIKTLLLSFCLCAFCYSYILKPLKPVLDALNEKVKSIAPKEEE